LHTKVTKYLSEVDVGEGWLGLYVPFEHGLCFISQASWSRIKLGDYGSVSRQTVELLKTKNVLVSKEFDEHCLDPYHRTACARINAMFLIVTRRCNFACRYCVVECNVKDSHRTAGHMNTETGVAAVDYFARLLEASQPLQTRVTYYGGEPTLNKAVLLATLPRIAEIRYRGQYHQVGSALITNGYQFDEDVTASLRCHRGGVCISLDGRAEQHDQARVTASGLPTHSRVIENIRRYQDAGIDVDISCTIGKHNIDVLPEIVRYFVKDVGISDIEIQIPYFVKTGNPDFIAADRLADQLLAAYDVLLELGTQEFTCYRRVHDFLIGRWRHRDCGAAGGQVTVSPDGRLGPCHSMVGNEQFFVGSVHDQNFDICSSPLFMEWSRRIPVNMPACHGCSLIGLCGGGCLFNAWVANGDIWKRDPQVCPYLQKLLPWIVRRIWKKGVSYGHVLQ
jgi:uncharacterized protein